MTNNKLTKSSASLCLLSILAVLFTACAPTANGQVLARLLSTANPQSLNTTNFGNIVTYVNLTNGAPAVNLSKSFNIVLGGSLVISLTDLPGTGYTYYTNVVGSSYFVASDSYVADAGSPMAGSGGIRTITLKADAFASNQLFEIVLVAPGVPFTGFSAASVATYAKDYKFSINVVAGVNNS